MESLVNDGSSKQGSVIPAVRRFVTGSHCIFIILTAGLCFSFYAVTAYRTIAWWDSSEYTLAACTLGIAHPPGSLLLTLLGWLVNTLTFGLRSVFTLNLFAGAIGAAACGVTVAIAGRLFFWPDTAHQHAVLGQSDEGRAAAFSGATLAALGFGFSSTVWTYAVQFTPYILTALFTALIVCVMFRWWGDAENQKSWFWLTIAALLIGLDFSVHRTNALLIPGIMAWILIRNPRVVLGWRTWAGSIGGLLFGLSVNLLMMPMAARNPLLNSNDPTSLRRVWEYVTIKQMGGSFLLTFFPRKADLWGHQVHDWFAALWDNFSAVDGPLGPLGVLPGLLAILGLVLMVVRLKRMGWAYLSLVVLSVAATIMYFNIPDNFFRPFDRHYLPTFILFAIPAVYAGGLLLKEALDSRQRRRGVVVPIVLAILAAGPAAQVSRNFSAVDGSRRTAARDIAAGMLNSLAPDAILFVNGDNDSFPLWCLQEVESIRRDVTVINIPLLNTDWYGARLAARNVALKFSIEPDSISRLRPLPVESSPLMIHIPISQGPGFFDISPETDLPDSIGIQLRTTFTDRYYLAGDQLVADIVAKNLNGRPIYFAATVSPLFLGSYADRLRLDGLCQRLIPIEPTINVQLLHHNLTATFDYRQFTDSTVLIDEVTMNFGIQLAVAWLTLAEGELSSGNPERCLAALDEMTRLLPPGRITFPDQLTVEVKSLTSSAEEATAASADTLPLPPSEM